MATVTWIGLGTGAWEIGANWSTGIVPTAADDAFINTSQVGTITHGVGVHSVNSLTINGKPDLSVTGGSLTILGLFISKSATFLSGGTLVVNGTGTLAAFTQSGGELGGAGVITVTAAMAFSTGTEGGTGTTVAKGGIALSGTGFGLDGGRTLELQGNSAATGAAVSVDMNATDPNTGLSTSGAGVLRIDAGALFDDQTTGGGLTLLATVQGGADTGVAAKVDNLGTFRRSGAAAASQIGVAFNNAGVVDARTGVLRLLAGGTDTGTFSFLPGATVEFGGGLHTLNGAKTTGTGLIDVSGGTLTSDTAFAIGGALTQTGGLLNGAGVITVTGLTTLTGGTQSGSGTTVAKGGIALPAGSSFALDGGRVLDLQANSALTGSGVTLDLNGVDPSTGLSAAGAGVLRISTGTQLDDQTSGSGFSVVVSNQGGGDVGASALVDVLGTFRRSGTAVSSKISAGFNNSGATDVLTGTLFLAGGGTDTGAFSTAAGTTLDFAGGAHAVNGAKATGTGLIRVSAGTVTVDTTFLISSNFAQTGGMLAGAGVVTITNPVTLSAGIQSGLGTTVAKSGATLSGTAFGLDAGRVLDLQSNNSVVTGATVSVDLNGVNPDTGLSAAGAGTLRIDVGGLLNDQTSGAGLSIFATNQGTADTGSAALVDNLGTFRRSGTAVTSTISAAFNNAGLLDAQTGALVLAGSLTNGAAGIIQVKAGARVVSLGTLTNFSAGTLTAGTFSIASKGGQPGSFAFAGGSIVTNAATISLDGNGASFLNGKVDALANLASNTAAGTLALLGDKVFTTSGNFANAGVVSTTTPSSFVVTGTLTNSGTVTLAGGTAGATVLTNSGAVSGFGAVSVGIGNSGIVRAAGGALTVSGAVTGTTGTLQADAAASLGLAQASSAAVLNLAAGSALVIGANNVTVSGDYNNAGAGVGNAFNARAGISGAGLILASGGVSARQTLSGDIGTATTADALLALGTIHVGDVVTKNYQIGDVAAAGPALRGAIQTLVNGGALTDARLSGAGVTAGNFGPVVAGANSGDLAVVFTGLTVGSLSGQSVHIVNNFANTNNQNLALTGAVFRLAAAGAHTPEPVAFGNRHVGDVVAAQTLTIGNTAAADGFSESLNASLATAAAGFTASGAFSGLVAGGVDASSLVIGLNTGSAGSKSGTASIALASNGAGIDGLGTTALSGQTVNVTGSVFRLAASGVHTPEPVSFGNRHVGDVVSQAISLGNTAAADGFSEKLNASIGGATAGVTASGAVSGLAAGSVDGVSLTVGLNTGSAGAKSGTASIALVSDGTGVDGLGLTALSGQTVNVTGSVFRLAASGAHAPEPVAFGNRHVGDVVSQAISLGNTAVADGFSEKLNAAIGGATAGVTASGAFSGLAAGGVDGTSLTVGLNTGSAGAKSGTAAITLVSDGAGIDALGTTALSGQTVNVTGSVFRLAAASVHTPEPVAFGIVHVGDIVSQAISVGNTAVADGFSERLNASIGGATAGVTASGSFSALAAGGTNGSGLAVGLNTATAGVKSGTATVTLVSDGTGVDGLGTSALGAQTVNVGGTVNNFAVAVFQELAGGGVFNQSGVNYTLALGFVQIGSAAVSISLAAINAASALADLLDGDFLTSGDAPFSTSGFGAFTNLAAGQGDNALSVTLATSQRGVFSETITLHPTGHNASGFSGALATETLTITANVACFAAGTRISVPGGQRLVEDLREGDILTMADGRERPVRWIGFRHLDLTRHASPEDAVPVVIQAGALAPGLPSRDLRVSPEHALFLCGGLVPARMLVNGVSITRDIGCRAVTYYHVELDTHDILLAEDAPAESYLDTGNRDMFENADLPILLHPRFAEGETGRLGRSCAPMLDDPADAEVIWRDLLAWSVIAGFPPVPGLDTGWDPEVVLMSGDRVTAPDSVVNGVYSFRLPAGSAPVRLRSRVVSPAALRPWVADRRGLGVSVRRILVRRGDVVETIAADHPGLTEGWWPMEREGAATWRWSSGDALLPIGPHRAMVIEVETAGEIEAVLAAA